MDSNELYHHGIPGQRWGVRRYQNPDGSLTPAGRKRAAKLVKKYAKVTGQKIGDKPKEQPKPKTVGEMSDDELRTKTNRMNLEKNYIEATRNLASLNPKQVSKGKKIMDSLSKTASSAATEAGKQIMKAYLIKLANDKLGINANVNDDKGKQQNNTQYTNQSSTKSKKQPTNEYSKAYEDMKDFFRQAAEEAQKQSKQSSRDDFYDATVNEYYDKSIPLLPAKKKRKR